VAVYYGKEQTLNGGAVMISQTVLRFIVVVITFLPQFNCHLVAAPRTLVQTKQTRINIHKRNNTKT